MKRWNGIEMGFRKRDEKERMRRLQRANETMLEYSRKKGHVAEVVMSNELHTYNRVIIHSCSMCIKSGLEAEDCLLSVVTHINGNVTDFDTWFHHVMNSKEWAEYPVLDVQCERGHVGDIVLNQILMPDKYPVYFQYANMGISWLEDGLAMGNIQGMRDAGRWPKKEEE